MTIPLSDIDPIAAGTLVGNDTNASAPPSALTIDAVRSMLGMVEQPYRLKAGMEPDLSGVLAQAQALANACIIELESITYIWPDDPIANVPLVYTGINLQGTGATVVPIQGGTIIESSGPLIQQTGGQASAIHSGVQFMQGFVVRKQMVVLFNCITRGKGLTLGGFDTAPYTFKAINCEYHADDYETCITLDHGANAVQLDGSVQMPRFGRGVACLGGEGVSLNLGFDYDYKPSGAGTDVGSLFYFDGTAKLIANIYYFETFTPSNFRDGGQVVFKSGFSNILTFQGDLSILRVADYTDATNYVANTVPDTEYRNTEEVVWGYAHPRSLLCGVNVVKIYLPPTSMRNGSLEFVCVQEATVYPAFYATTASLANEGSSGVDGIHYETLTDDDFVFGPTIKFTVSGGSIDGGSVSLVNGGWSKTTGPTSLSVTAAGLVGASVNLDWGSDSIIFNNPTWKARPLQLYTLMNQHQQTWILAPAGNLVLPFSGLKLFVKEGFNGSLGVAVLSSGSCTIANTLITANSRIFLQRQAAGGTIGDLTYTVVAGAAFTVHSASSTDTSTVNYWIVEPA